MSVSANVSPVNSLLFLSDSGGGTPPIPVWGAQIQATPSCISFICYPEQDGPTQVVFGPRNEVDPRTAPAFDGDLETPHQQIIVSTVDQQTILQARVASTQTHILIWLSHPRWPEKVIIGFD